MKVCILSMQRVANFGSVLQAYSLKKIIETIIGEEVYFIDIQANLEEGKLANRINDFSKENGKRKLINKIDVYLPNRLFNYFKYKKQIKIIEQFQLDVLKLDNKPYEYFDYCVIGSDEVFNCMQPSSWGYTSQLFGNVKCASKVLSYAASCGSTSIDNLSNKLKENISNALSNLNKISVRDQNTYEFIYKLTNKIPVINFDPVFIGDFDKEIDAFVPSMKKYCIIYSYYNRVHSENEIHAIKDFCKKNNLRIVSVFAPQFWIKKHLVLSPFEMLSFFKNADFVITDTFHGTIFSAKYAKRFAIIVRESNSNKLDDLIGRLNISEHKLSKDMDLNRVYCIYDDKSDIKNLEMQGYLDTIDYLKNAIVN